jgi:hypothetical protein
VGCGCQSDTTATVAEFFSVSLPTPWPLKTFPSINIVSSVVIRPATSNERRSLTTRIAKGLMILFGDRGFAPVSGSLERVPVSREQERVAAETYRLILHLPALISDVIRVR